MEALLGVGGAPPCGTAATRLTPEDEEHPAEVLERHHQDRVGQRHPRVDAAHDARLHRRRCRVDHLVCFVIGNRRTCDIARASRSRDDDGASVLEQSSRAGDLFIWVLNSMYRITDISYHRNILRICNELIPKQFGLRTKSSSCGFFRC